MAQAISRAVFNQSGLVRALADLSVVAPVARPSPSQSFSDRLGQWIGFSEALSLYSTLNAARAEAPKQSGPRMMPAEAAALRARLVRVREALVAVVSALPQSQGEGASDYAPYHRHHVICQRQMSADIGQLRAQVRTALARLSPALRHLAELDAVMEQSLMARERNLLATLPVFLRKRFEQLCVADRSEADDGLETFLHEMQRVLLAELDLRLQPVEGLVSALENKGPLAS